MDYDRMLIADVLSMHEDGFDIDDIMDETGLDYDEVEEIIQDYEFVEVKGVLL